MRKGIIKENESFLIDERVRRKKRGSLRKNETMADKREKRKRKKWFGIRLNILRNNSIKYDDCIDF